MALITGGAGHVGAAIGDALAELSANVVILDTSLEACSDVCKRIAKQYGVETFPICADLAFEEQIHTVPLKVVREFRRLDILINCAAFVSALKLPGWTTVFEEQSPETWRRALEVNLTAPFILTQACWSALKKSGHGSVINVASIYGVCGPDMRLYEGTNMGNPAAYAASKGGLVQLTRWLATVMAPEVRVNALSSGGIWRNQPKLFCDKYVDKTPLRRMATEEDLKGPVAYLASDMSAYVTGQNIIIDGGWTVW